MQPARMVSPASTIFVFIRFFPFFRIVRGRAEDRNVATDASRTICSMRPMTSSGTREGFMQTGEPTTVRTKAASNWKVGQGGGAGRSACRCLQPKSKAPVPQVLATNASGLSTNLLTKSVDKLTARGRGSFRAIKVELNAVTFGLHYGPPSASGRRDRPYHEHRLAA